MCQDAAVDGLCRFVNAVTAVVLYISARPRLLGASIFDRNAPDNCPAVGLERLGLLLAGIDSLSNSSTAADASPEEAYCRFLRFAGLGLGALHSTCLAVVLGVLLATPFSWWAAAHQSNSPAQQSGRPRQPVKGGGPSGSRAPLRTTKAGRELAAAARLSLG